MLPGAIAFTITPWGPISRAKFFVNMTTPPFDDESLRLELLRRLNEVPDVSITADKVTKRPWFYLSLLKDDAALERFLGVLDWIVEEIKTS